MSTVEAELRIHNGRTLARHTDPDDGQAVAGWPEMARESIRAINHLTLTGPLPALTVYDVLGELKGVGHLLPQTLTQLARGLQQSLTELDVYDHAGDPARSVATAGHHLLSAAEHAHQLGLLLKAAQADISQLGYRWPFLQRS